MNEGFELYLVWAQMPLSDEELEKIPSSHRIRPYLLCLEKEDYYYAFPATSHAFDSKIRYENEKVILTAIDYRKSLINLSKIYKLPKENILSDEYPVKSIYINEIIKKIQANSEYCDYPGEVNEAYAKLSITYSDHDLIEVRGQLYVIVGSYKNEQLIVLPVYKYPVNKTVPKETDGLIYYVDVKNISLISLNNIDKYCSKLYGFARGSVQTEEELKEFSKNYIYNEKITTRKKYKNFGELDRGMIVQYTYNNKKYKIIILDKTSYDIEALIGEDETTYSTFEPISLPLTLSLNYEIVGTLNSERLEDLIMKSSYKLNGCSLSIKK